MKNTLRQGEIKPLEVTSISSTSSNGTYTFTCNAEGGFTPYSYYAYVLKDGKIWYKVLDSDNASFSYTPTESGTYKVVMYCVDAQDTMAKGQTTFTV